VLPVGFVNGQIRTAERALLFKAFEGFGARKTNGVHPEGESWNQIWLEIQHFAGLIREHQEATGASQARLEEFQANSPQL
jgi:hypothetical protein